MYRALPPKYALLVISVVLMLFYARRESDLALSPAPNVEDQTITRINSVFWETAHLPLPQANINTYYSVGANVALGEE